MSEDKNVDRLVPKLRFKGFTDDWKQHLLGDVTNRIKSYSIPHSLEIQNITSTKAIHYGDIHTKKVKNIQSLKNLPNIIDKDYISLKKGDVIIADASEDYKGIADAAILNLDPAPYKVIAGLHTIALRPKNNLNSNFLFTYFGTDIFKHYGYKAGSGLKVFGISFKELSKFRLNMPTYKEQKIISTIIEKINQALKIQEHKLKQLKLLKKGLLQKMFDDEKSNMPEIRFNGFNDPWKQHLLLNLLSQPITDGPHETPIILDKGIPFISAEAISNNKIDFNKKRGYISEKYNQQCNKKYTPQKNDVYLVKSGSTVGKVAVVNTTEVFNIWSPIAAMRVNKNNDAYFLYYLLQTDKLQQQIINKSRGGTQPNLSMRLLEKFKVNSPIINSQHKIANLLIKVDNIISIQEKRLSYVKQIKKFLLQNMFI